MSRQINLFNPIFLKQEKHFSALTMAQALGVILAGCVALSVYASYRVAVLSRDAQNVAAQLSAAQASLNKINETYAPRQQSKSVEDQIATAEAEIKSLQQALVTLQSGDMGDTKGYSEYMRAFAREIVDGVWLTGFGIQGAGNEMELGGRALRPDLVPVYLGRLKREPVLQGKSFAALDLRLPEAKSDDKSGDPVPKIAPYIEFTLRSAPPAQGDSGERR